MIHFDMPLLGLHRVKPRDPQHSEYYRVVWRTESLNNDPLQKLRPGELVVVLSTAIKHYQVMTNKHVGWMEADPNWICLDRIDTPDSDF